MYDAGIGRQVHYLYRLTYPPTGEFYIGVRTCYGAPVQDRYWGSGKWPQHASYKRIPLRKEVLGTFPNRASAQEAEQLLIDMVLRDPLCRNSVVTASAQFKEEHCTRRHGLRLRDGGRTA